MSRKISQLDLISVVGDEDYTVVVQDGVTKRYKPKALLAGLDKADVGLNLVDNFGTAGQVAAETGLANDVFMTPLRTAQAIAALTPEPVQPDRYDVKSGTPAGTALDLAAQQFFTINASGAKTISFLNVPAAGRAQPVVIEILGNGGTFTWPTISWDDGAPPALGATLTLISLVWTGTKWIGTVSVTI